MGQLPSFAYDAVVFDCDGIILRSNRIKSDAFGDALPDEPLNLRRDFVAWHQAHGGVSRFAKFRHYFTVIAPHPDPEPRIADAITRYGEIVEQRLVSCATGPGLEPLLALLGARGIACSVNSGGAETELRRVFAVRGLDKHFRLICGSPTDKSGNMQRLRDAGLLGRSALMIGDSRSDFLAARAHNLDFAYVTLDSEWEDGPEEMQTEVARGDVFIFQDLMALNAWAGG